ncbi:MAG: S-methyl-5-thioribose-1-phosphate isomerase, partial [Candidatus Zixiibacteriota bacterium]
KIIDQTVLPAKLKYLKLDDYQKVISAIKKMQIRGAPAIGIAAAYGLAMAVSKAKKFDKAFVSKVAGELKDSRPTAVNLFWAVDRMMRTLKKESPQTLTAAQKILWAEAARIHDEDRQMCLEIGKNGSAFIKDGDTILTHCNTGALATGGIGTALGIIYFSRDQGKKIQIYADETRPVLQGARLTAWELMQEKIPVTLICDSAAGVLLQKGKIQHVIVGADRITENGDVANKIGTYSLAVLAQKHGVPFYVAAPTSTFDSSIESGNEIKIEERSPSEIINAFGKATAPKNVKVFSPAFDITPRDLVSYYITDKGITPGGRSRH